MCFKNVNLFHVPRFLSRAFKIQSLFVGNPFYDVAKYVVGFSDADVRRELEIDLVEDYYAHLKEGVEKKGGKLDFGIEQVCGNLSHTELLTVQRSPAIVPYQACLKPNKNCKSQKV